MIRYTTFTILDKDNCFLIVSLVTMVKLKHKGLHSGNLIVLLVLHDRRLRNNMVNEDFLKLTVLVT